MFNLKRRRQVDNANDVGGSSQNEEEPQVPKKSFFITALPVFACGAGLFSDGYINNVRYWIATNPTQPLCTALELTPPGHWIREYNT